MMSSCGSWSMTARATVSPPNPESKMPMGASVSATTSAQPTSCLSPNLGVQEILAGVEVAAVGARRQIFPAAIGDDQHNVCRLTGIDGLGRLRQPGVQDRSG